MSNLNAMNPAQPGSSVTLEWERLDVVNAEEAKTILKAAAENTTGDLHIDLRNVRFVDSSGLGALVAARKSLPPQGNVCLTNVSPNTRKLLGLTKLDRVFQVR